MQQIAIVAGEPSGDLLGAGLIRVLKKSYPHTEFIGVGGDAMAEAGCNLLFRMERIGVMGVDGLLTKLSDILSIRKQLFERFRQDKPLVFIGIDVPDFNIGLESKLRAEQILCVHYVSPTVWAWRGYRIHKIKRAVDHMLTLFPFEASFYERHQVPVTFVGHPMADEIEDVDVSKLRQQEEVNGKPVIALLPGSRRSEVKRLTRLLIESARLLLKTYPQAQFILPLANARVASTFRELSGDISDLPMQVWDGRARQAMQVADLAVLASGTAALEAALTGCPHIVVYRVSKISEWLMKPLKHVDHYSMTNHLLPNPDIPELIQNEASPSNVEWQVRRMLDDPGRIEQLKAQFADIRAQLKQDASAHAARVIRQLLEAKSAS